MKKKFAVLSIVSALLLAGCGSSTSVSSSTNTSEVSESRISLSDGRSVVCLIFEDGYRGGMDCDWENAR